MYDEVAPVETAAVEQRREFAEMPVRKSTSDVASMAWRPWFSSVGDAPRHCDLCTGRCSTVLGAASGRSLSVICPKVVLTLTVDIIIDVIGAKFGCALAVIDAFWQGRAGYS